MSMETHSPRRMSVQTCSVCDKNITHSLQDVFSDPEPPDAFLGVDLPGISEVPKNGFDHQQCCHWLMRRPIWPRSTTSLTCVRHPSFTVWACRHLRPPVYHQHVRLRWRVDFQSHFPAVGLDGISCLKFHGNQRCSKQCCDCFSARHFASHLGSGVPVHKVARLKACMSEAKGEDPLMGEQCLRIRCCLASSQHSWSLRWFPSQSAIGAPVRVLSTCLSKQFGLSQCRDAGQSHQVAGSGSNLCHLPTWERRSSNIAAICCPVRLP